MTDMYTYAFWNLIFKILYIFAQVSGVVWQVHPPHVYVDINFIALLQVEVQLEFAITTTTPVQQQGHALIAVPLFFEFSTLCIHESDNRYRVSVLHLKTHHPCSMVFAWLWVYEFAVLLLFTIHMQHARLKEKPDTFVSARGSEVRQVLQSLSDALVRSGNERKNIASDGIIQWLSLLLLSFACFKAHSEWFFQRLPLSVDTLREHPHTTPPQSSTTSVTAST